MQYYSSPLSRPRPLIENALLYNDGGFDISVCGRVLVTCAEFHPQDLVLGPGGGGRYGERGDGGSGSGGGEGVVDVFRLPHLVKLSLVPFLHDDDEDEEEKGRVKGEQGRRKQQPQQQQQQQQQQQPKGMEVEGGAAAGAACAAAAAAVAATPSWYNEVSAVTSMDGGEGEEGGGATDSKSKKEDQKTDGKQQEEDGEKKGKEEQKEEGEGEEEKEGYQYHGSRQRYLAPILSARPLSGVAMGGVTSVKLSATGSMVLLGYGGVRVLREGGREGEREGDHVVAEVYETGRMERVRSLRGGGREGGRGGGAEEEDVNIARFHPSAGHGFVYGTKQGRICVFGPKRGQIG